jgi:hypothetical protein
MTEKKYKTDTELQEAIDTYFALDPEKPTITGLALHLGFVDRRSIYDYEESGEHSHTIKKARMRVENAFEKRLFEQSCTGAIFALKNFGWKDKTENEITGKDGTPLFSEIVIKHVKADT